MSPVVYLLLAWSRPREYRLCTRPIYRDAWWDRTNYGPLHQNCALAIVEARMDTTRRAREAR